MLDLLQQFGTREGYKMLRIDGSVPPKQVSHSIVITLTLRLRVAFTSCESIQSAKRHFPVALIDSGRFVLCRASVVLNDTAQLVLV